MATSIKVVIQFISLNGTNNMQTTLFYLLKIREDSQLPKNCMEMGSSTHSILKYPDLQICITPPLSNQLVQYLYTAKSLHSTQPHNRCITVPSILHIITLEYLNSVKICKFISNPILNTKLQCHHRVQTINKMARCFHVFFKSALLTDYQSQDLLCFISYCQLRYSGI